MALPPIAIAGIVLIVIVVIYLVYLNNQPGPAPPACTAGSCGSVYTCNTTSGQCNTSCTGSSDITSCASPNVCNSSSQCVAPCTADSCGSLYTCNTTSGQCNTSCTGSSDITSCASPNVCTGSTCGPATPVASCAYSYNQGPSNPTILDTATTCNSAYPSCNGHISNLYWGVCGSSDTPNETTCNSDSDCNNTDYTIGLCDTNNVCIYWPYGNCSASGDYVGSCTTTDSTCFTGGKTPLNPTDGPNCCWSGLTMANTDCYQYL